jgi:coenzyme F420 hydrogenase subunit beta
LEHGIIDSAVVSGMTKDPPWMVEPRFANSRTEILESARSKYVIFPHNQVLRDLSSNGFEKVGFVGCPCHIHGLRKIQLFHPAVLQDKVKFILGLLCACNWSLRGTQRLLQSGAGIRLHNVSHLDYRGGEDRTSIEVRSFDGERVLLSAAARRRYLQGFSRDRCLMCCDFTSELSDLSFGDLFDVHGTNKTPGWSTILVRTEKGRSLLSEAERAGYIRTFLITKAQFVRNLGFEQKTYGGLYHILERRKFGWPTPSFGYPISDRLLNETPQYEKT